MKTDKQHITLLTTNAIGFPPFIFHKAIKFYGTDNRPYIIHRATSGAEITDYGTFMKGRHIIHEEVYPIKFQFDPLSIVKEDKKEFDWVNNNCEDFTTEVIKKTSGKNIRPSSPQRTFWLAILIIGLITLILAKS